MRNKILIVLSVMFVFGLFATAFALTKTNVNAEKTASSCPMHNQTSAGTVTTSDSCCDMADCCKEGICAGGDCCKDKDSCPMNKNQDASTAQSMDMSKVTVSVSSEDCCQTGADCCKGGACCHKKS